MNFTITLIAQLVLFISHQRQTCLHHSYLILPGFSDKILILYLFFGTAVEQDHFGGQGF